VRPTLESAGKTRYISTTTFDILLVDTPAGIRPVKAAPVINVSWVSGKSSPVSISNLPGLSGRVAVATRPSGLPVLKTNASAAAGNGIAIAAKVSAAIPVRAFNRMRAMDLPPFWGFVMGRIFRRLNRGAFIYTPFIRLMRDHDERFFGQATKASIFF